MKSFLSRGLALLLSFSLVAEPLHAFGGSFALSEPTPIPLSLMHQQAFLPALVGSAYPGKNVFPQSISQIMKFLRNLRILRSRTYQFLTPEQLGLDAQPREGLEVESLQMARNVEAIWTKVMQRVQLEGKPKKAEILNVGSGLHPLVLRSSELSASNIDYLGQAQQISRRMGANHLPISLDEEIARRRLGFIPSPHVLLFHGKAGYIIKNPASFWASAWSFVPEGGWLLFLNPPSKDHSHIASLDSWVRQLEAVVQPESLGTTYVVSPDETMQNALAIAIQKPQATSLNPAALWTRRAAMFLGMILTGAAYLLAGSFGALGMAVQSDERSRLPEPTLNVHVVAALSAATQAHPMNVFNVLISAPPIFFDIFNDFLAHRVMQWTWWSREEFDDLMEDASKQDAYTDFTEWIEKLKALRPATYLDKPVSTLREAEELIFNLVLQSFAQFFVIRKAHFLNEYLSSEPYTERTDVLQYLTAISKVINQIADDLQIPQPIAPLPQWDTILLHYFPALSVADARPFPGSPVYRVRVAYAAHRDLEKDYGMLQSLLEEFHLMVTSGGPVEHATLFVNFIRDLIPKKLYDEVIDIVGGLDLEANRKKAALTDEEVQIFVDEWARSLHVKTKNQNAKKQRANFRVVEKGNGSSGESGFLLSEVAPAIALGILFATLIFTNHLTLGAVVAFAGFMGLVILRAYRLGAVSGVWGWWNLLKKLYLNDEVNPLVKEYVEYAYASVEYGTTPEQALSIAEGRIKQQLKRILLLVGAQAESVQWVDRCPTEALVWLAQSVFVMRHKAPKEELQLDPLGLLKRGFETQNIPTIEGHLMEAQLYAITAFLLQRKVLAEALSRDFAVHYAAFHYLNYSLKQRELINQTRRFWKAHPAGSPFFRIGDLDFPRAKKIQAEDIKLMGKKHKFLYSPMTMLPVQAREGEIVFDVGSGLTGIDLINSLPPQPGLTLLSDTRSFVVQVLQQTLRWIPRSDVRVVQLNGGALPFVSSATRRFRVITAIGAVQHFSDAEIQSFLSDARQLLSPRGQLWVNGAWSGDPDQERKNRALEQQARQAGFDIVSSHIQDEGNQGLVFLTAIPRASAQKGISRTELLLAMAATGLMTAFGAPWILSWVQAHAMEILAAASLLIPAMVINSRGSVPLPEEQARQRIEKDFEPLRRFYTEVRKSNFPQTVWGPLERAFKVNNDSIFIDLARISNEDQLVHTWQEAFQRWAHEQATAYLIAPTKDAYPGEFLPNQRQIMDIQQQIIEASARPIAPEEKILELGIGHGKFAIALLLSGASRVTALDISEGLAQFARSVLSSVAIDVEKGPLSRQLDLSVSDGTALPFREGTFHRVYARQVLTGNAPWSRPQVIAEAFRVLKPGGQFDVMDLTVNSNDPKYELYKAWDWTPEQWIEEFKKVGFQVRSTTRYGYIILHAIKPKDALTLTAIGVAMIAALSSWMGNSSGAVLGALLFFPWFKAFKFSSKKIPVQTLFRRAA